ncbi:MAG: M4 family metallopeptidase [Gammaproteobacteria bacterium]
MVNLPDTPGSDNSGVCINSGIPNRSVYLIAEGLSAECLGISIGCDKTEQIYYRTLTTYLTKSSQFVDARRALIQAAEDIYGPTESQAVATEFEAVGVTEDSTLLLPSRAPRQLIHSVAMVSWPIYGQRMARMTVPLTYP